MKMLHFKSIFLLLSLSSLFADSSFPQSTYNTSSMEIEELATRACDPGYLVFTSNEVDYAFDIYKMNPDGTEKQNISNDTGVLSHEPSISGDGWRIVWYGGPPHDASVMTILANGYYRQDIIDGGNAVSPDISSGYPRLAYVVVGGEQLRICRLDGSEDKQIAQGSCPDWSPDATKIAYSLWQGSGHSGEIWVYDLQSGVNEQLTAGGDLWPEWSPDGTQIVYTGNEGGVPEIWVMDSDGSNPDLIAVNGTSPSWSPDGSQIAFIRDGDIWIMNADGSSQVNITNTPWIESQVDWGSSPCQAGFELSENFDSYTVGTSLNDIPGWSSHDGSGIYDTDATVVSDITVTTSPPNHFRLVGYPNVPVSATMHINSPDPIKNLILSFDYELQQNANGKVEISSSPDTGWAELDPLVKMNDNIIDDSYNTDLTGLLEPIGVYRDVYIRWSSYTDITSWSVFNVDTVKVTVVTEPSALRYSAPSIGNSGCEPSIGILGDTKIGEYISVVLKGALHNYSGYLLAGINSSRTNIGFGSVTLLFNPINFFFPIIDRSCDGFFLFGPVNIPHDPNITGYNLNFQYVLTDPLSDYYSTAGLEVYIQ